MKIFGLLFSILLCTSLYAQPLHVCTANPRYVCDAGEVPQLLTGSHTWNNLYDKGPTTFNYTQYLDFLVANNHNTIRLWLLSRGFSKTSQTTTSYSHRFHTLAPAQVSLETDDQSLTC